MSSVEKFQLDYDITNNAVDYVIVKDLKEYVDSSNFGSAFAAFNIELKKHAIIYKLDNVFTKAQKVEGKTETAWYGIRRALEIPSFQAFFTLLSDPSI